MEATLIMVKDKVPWSGHFDVFLQKGQQAAVIPLITERSIHRLTGTSFSALIF